MGQMLALPTRSRRQRSTGFTMMELLVTMAIIAILAAVAVPGMREFSVRTNVSTTTNDLVQALNLARSEAVKRGRNVSLVRNGASWTNGWTMQLADGTVLSQRAAVQNSYRVLGLASGGGAPADRVIFTGIGALSIATAWDFSVCRPTFSPGNAQSRRVIVTATGTIRSRRDTTGAPAGACT